MVEKNEENSANTSETLSDFKTSDTDNSDTVGDSHIYEKNEDSDLILQGLVHMAEFGLGLSVTLQVKGCTITGILTSRENYIENFVSTLSQGFSNSSEDIQNFVKDSYLTPLTELGKHAAEVRPIDAFWFIHLREAKLITGNSQFIPTHGNGIFWRGSINSIDGFFLGVISSTK